MAIWTPSMQFLQPGQKILSMRLKCFIQIPKTIMFISPFQKFSENSYSHAESVYDNAAEKLLTKGQNLFNQCPGIKKTLI